MDLKLGKLPARPGAVQFKMAHYFNASDLPKPPSGGFGHYGFVKNRGVLGNDRYGDCVWAGADHEHMMWAFEHDRHIEFSADTALSDYGDMTGFSRWNPLSDQGTDMAAAASYRRKTGIVDAAGNRHKIDAYVEMRLQDWDQLRLAVYLFGAAGIGIELPRGAMDQFRAERPWDVDGSSIEGGHYIPCVGFNSHGLAIVVTWGRLQGMTRRFYEAHNDEALAYISAEALNAKGLSPEGFDAARLAADLGSLAA